ncbi:hypothetical protein RYH80_18425 [Halobaculum sp. MBLA0147]|uniref:hypothetical protein n=1 Tax=Halobaculum sp. MBLA0147 TaxID=3079934 RepID=UPI0035237B9F
MSGNDQEAQGTDDDDESPSDPFAPMEPDGEKPSSPSTVSSGGEEAPSPREPDVASGTGTGSQSPASSTDGAAEFGESVDEQFDSLDVAPSDLAQEAVPSAVDDEDGELSYFLARKGVQQGRSGKTISTSDNLDELLDRGQRHFESRVGKSVSPSDWYAALLIAGLANLDDVNQVFQTWDLSRY